MYQSDLVKKIKDTMEVKSVDVEKLTYDLNLYDYSDDERDELIKQILGTRPLRVISYLIPYVNKKNIIEEITLESNDPYYRESYRCDIYTTLKIDGFNRIIELKCKECGILSNDEDGEYIDNSLHDFDFNYDVERFDAQSGDVRLVGKFSGGGDMLRALDYCELAAEFHVVGIESTIDVPSWIEYLIEGCVNIEKANMKMAFFNIFSSFENFINYIHDDIFDYYLEKYRTNSTGENEENIKEKIRLFSNQEKRLRNKLRHIIKELEMGKNEGFEKLNKIIETWEKKYIPIRNAISHGKTCEEVYYIEEVLYNILSIIFSILMHEDVNENIWENIIFFEEE